MLTGTSHISWTDRTANPTVGCSPISPGCDHCYARTMVNAFMGGDFEQIRLHEGRIPALRDIPPIQEPDGPRPSLVFVNSMSDLFHKDIPDLFRDLVFDAIDANPRAVFQVLTKRHLRMAEYIGQRYAGRAVPDHLWLGVSVEDGPRGVRLNALRAMKARIGPFTAFASVEPLMGRLDVVSFEGIDWVLVGGESGGNARRCEPAHVREAVDMAELAGAAVWFKQWGTWKSNPLYAAAGEAKHLERVSHAIASGEQFARVGVGKNGKPKVLGEKGGATLDGLIYRERPSIYGTLTDRMRQSMP